MAHQDDTYDEFGPVAERLRADRPTATALELDAVKQRVLARAAAPSPNRRRGDFMRSRVAILTTLVLGFTLSSAGAGLAVSGFTDDQASVAQYPGNTPSQNVIPPSNTPPAGGVQGESDEQPGTGGGVLPDTDVTATQPSRQVEFAAQSSGGSLPFTGFAAIPILLLGVALFATGLVLRRSPGRQS